MEKNISKKEFFRKSKTVLILGILMSGLILLLPGCQEDDPGAVLTSNTEDNLSVGFFTEIPAADNTLSLTEAKFNVKSMKLDNEGHHGECNVKVGPFVVYLDLTPKYVNAAITVIPVDRYESVKFNIHKPGPNETMSDPDFIESTSRRYSVVAKGYYNSEFFVYKADITVERSVNLDNLVEINERPLVNITLTVNPYEWFTENGVILDPRIDANKHVINQNIRESLRRAFRDMNCDGHPD
jgi:hypothetical protein